MTSVFKPSSAELEIKKIVEASNKFNTTATTTTTNPAVVQINPRILSYEERRLLCTQIKDLAIQFVRILRDLSINIFYNWIDNITLDNCIDYVYDMLLNGINMSINSLNDMTSIENIRHSYNKTIFMNAVIIYGACVYFLNKLIQFPLVKKTQSVEIVNTVVEKIELEYKAKFYIDFYNQIDFIINYFDMNENYNMNVYQLSYDKAALFSLLMDCCENIESLHFNDFLNQD